MARRSLKPLHQSSGRPTGPRWLALRKIMWRQWGGYGCVCYHCGHKGANAVGHLISPDKAPDLAWEPSNLRPTHHVNPVTGQAGRCGTCGLNCNWVAHNSPLAPHNSNGEELPFSAQFIAEQQKRRKERLKPAIPARTPAKPAANTRSAPVEHVSDGESVGRVW